MHRIREESSTTVAEGRLQFATGRDVFVPTVSIWHSHIGPGENRGLALALYPAAQIHNRIIPCFRYIHQFYIVFFYM